MRAKRGTYNKTDIESFDEVIDAYEHKFRPTYKLICISKGVGFKKFRRYMLDTYEFDPDDVDRSVSVAALKKGLFQKMFVCYENTYASRPFINMYLEYYKIAKQHKLDLRDRFLYNKVCEIKHFDKMSIQRLKERYSLIPAEKI